MSERLLRRVGSTVGKYRIQRLLGIGGMGAVYAAEHRNGHRAAVKFLLDRFGDDPDVGRLFRREAYVANQVGHPGAVAVLDDDVDDQGCPFLVMPLLEGETLRARWEQRGRCLAPVEAGVFMADVLDVLASAHAHGIVHRDIKPENIFISRTGSVHVLDFGIARVVGGEDSGTLTGRMLGTPSFMAPEQARGDRSAIGPHSDLWAAGATLFTLLSGELVHAAESAGAQLIAAATRPARPLDSVAPEISREMARFVDRSLAFEPRDRWPSARSMRDALLEAWETKLGAPMESMAADTRARVATELSPAAATAVGARQQTPPAPRGIEVFAALRHLLDAFLVPAIARRILVKHQLARFDEKGAFQMLVEGPPEQSQWWPQETYLAILGEIAEEVGSAKMVEIGKLLAKFATVPPQVRDIRAAMAGMDVGYHLHHRLNGQPMFDVATGQMLEGIGHRRYLSDLGRNLIIMEVDGPYSCDLQRGVFFGFARRFEKNAFVDHPLELCREHGADKCTYYITW